MAGIKISSKFDETVWEEFRILASDSHQNISGLLTEAIREYLHDWLRKSLSRSE